MKIFSMKFGLNFMGNSGNKQGNKRGIGGQKITKENFREQGEIGEKKLNSIVSKTVF